MGTAHPRENYLPKVALLIPAPTPMPEPKGSQKTLQIPILRDRGLFYAQKGVKGLGAPRFLGVVQIICPVIDYGQPPIALEKAWLQ